VISESAPYDAHLYPNNDSNDCYKVSHQKPHYMALLPTIVCHSVLFVATQGDSHNASFPGCNNPKGQLLCRGVKYRENSGQVLDNVEFYSCPRALSAYFYDCKITLFLSFRKIFAKIKKSRAIYLHETFFSLL
jgi:hypothetical protein